MKAEDGKALSHTRIFLEGGMVPSGNELTRAGWILMSGCEREVQRWPVPTTLSRVTDLSGFPSSGTFSGCEGN